MNEYVTQGATLPSSSSARLIAWMIRSRRGSAPPSAGNVLTEASHAATSTRTPSTRPLFMMPAKALSLSQLVCGDASAIDGALRPSCRFPAARTTVGVTRTAPCARTLPILGGVISPWSSSFDSGWHTTMESAMVVISWLTVLVALPRGRGTPLLRPAPAWAAGALSPINARRARYRRSIAAATVFDWSPRSPAL